MTSRPTPTIIDDAISTLSRTRWNILDAPDHVPSMPGLYAIYGDEQSWVDLDLNLDLQPATPLYIGKAEDSLATRDLRGHFAIDPMSPPRTGGSTVRRSFAALLRETLNLHAVPRNLAKPERFASFGLAAGGDARLNDWMHEHLSLAIWVAPSDRSWTLKDVETATIIRLRPMLNIAGNPRKLPQLQRARAVMAAEAKSWADSR